MAEPLTVRGLCEAISPALGKKGEEVVMTLAERLIAEGRMEGRRQGLREGMEKGIEKGIERGLEAGRIETLREIALRMFNRMIARDQIADVLGVSVEEVRELLSSVTADSKSRGLRAKGAGPRAKGAGPRAKG